MRRILRALRRRLTWSIVPWMVLWIGGILYLYLGTDVTPVDSLPIVFSWIGIGFIGLLSWFSAAYNREADLMASALLSVDVLPPRDSDYADCFEIRYANLGTCGLRAEVEIHAFPSLHGRSDSINPVFNAEIRQEITSLSPFEMHELILGIGEKEDHPYPHFAVMPAMGLHGHIPQWLTFRIRSWPSRRRDLLKEESVYFYLVWFCTEENAPSGKWNVQRIQKRSQSFYNNPETKAEWRSQLSSVVPDDFRDANHVKYMERRRRN